MDSYVKQSLSLFSNPEAKSECLHGTWLWVSSRIDVMTLRHKRNCVCMLVGSVCSKGKLCLSPTPAGIVLEDYKGWREYNLIQS